MDIESFIWAGVLSLLPIAELRGGIPYAMAAGGAPWWLAYIYCVGMNALVAPLGLLFLNTLHRLLRRVKAYATLFDSLVGRARRKVSGLVEKYGYWGLLVFVAIPLPFTGAWTGVLGAWVLGMRWRKSSLFIIMGVALAGVIVTTIMTLGIKGFDFFLKRA